MTVVAPESWVQKPMCPLCGDSSAGAGVAAFLWSQQDVLPERTPERLAVAV